MNTALALGSGNDSLHDPAFYLLQRGHSWQTQFRFSEKELGFLLQREASQTGKETVVRASGTSLQTIAESIGGSSGQIHDAWRYYQCAAHDIPTLLSLPRPLFTKLLYHSVTRISTLGTMVDHVGALIRDLRFLGYPLRDEEWKLVEIGFRKCLVWEQAEYMMGCLDSWGFRDPAQVAAFLDRLVGWYMQQGLVDQVVHVYTHLSENHGRLFAHYANTLFAFLLETLQNHDARSQLLFALYTHLATHKLPLTPLLQDKLVHWMYRQDRQRLEEGLRPRTHLFDSFVQQRNTNPLTLHYLLTMALTLRLSSCFESLWNYATQHNPFHPFTRNAFIFLSHDTVFLRLRSLLSQKRETEAMHLFRRYLSSLNYHEKRGGGFRYRGGSPVDVRLHQSFLGLALELGCTQTYSEHRAFLAATGYAGESDAGGPRQP
ncbi:hypothetical protein HDV03_000867 [Kappamyces sp. JEL0829]|nr:hypothetical protein HDV03_000867 [Kappamyces sp. JEL0829]